MPTRVISLVALALLLAACGGTPAATATPIGPGPNPTAPAATSAPETSAPMTSAPITDAPATDSPATDAPATMAPGASLDPSLSDAGVVGRVTIGPDSRGDRTGTHDIVGGTADGFGSECTFSFEGDEFIAVAYDDDAANGAVRQMGLSVATDVMPVNDGEQRADIADGAVYIDFQSESYFGTAYTGDPTDDDRTTSTIDIVVAGDMITFSFEATTWDEIPFSGQIICAGVDLD